MPTDVILPQMGESITEGTITKWRVAEGDAVDRDDPLFDLATDKVDTEVPAAVAGRLAEILVPEGETVAVNTVVARIAGAGEEAPAPGSRAAEGDGAEATPADDRAGGGAPERPAEPGAPDTAARPADAGPQPRKRPRSSPLVRRMAKEHGVDLAEVPGTGEGGRVSKQDMLAWIERLGSREAVPPPAPEIPPEIPEIPSAVLPEPPPAPVPRLPERPVPQPVRPPPPSDAGGVPVGPAPVAGADARSEPMSRMRRSIAEHMTHSRRTAAHVTTVFEVDMSKVVAVRERQAAAFEERTGLRLTLMPFFARAAVDALAEFPLLNASLDGDRIVHHRSVHLGIAVALPDGLIVPVLDRADERNFVGVARGIADLAARARSGALHPEEVTGGTFTITNPGPFGALFGTPIIAQPQSAILGIGGVHKRAVVVAGDAIAVRSMVFLALSFDHRLIDGAVADRFLASVKERLENWREAPA